VNRLRAFAAEWRPSAITGGAPIYPLLILFGLNAVDELDRTAFAVLTPEIRDHFRLDIQGILTIVSLTAFLAPLVGITVAYFADRTKRVRIAAGGAAMWGLFSLLTGFAPLLWMLALARAFAGMGRAVNTPTHNSLIADYYDVDVRPKVYGVHRVANSLGQMVGPAFAGLLAVWFTWRVPFVVFAFPTLILVLLAVRLREPVRGAHERRAAGASVESQQIEEDAPNLGEAWRILYGVKTLRRIWYAIPFLTAATLGLPFLLSIYYEQNFGLDEAQRGFIAAFAEPVQIAALAIGVPIANRLLLRDPGLVLKFVAVIGALVSGGWVLLAAAPNLATAVAANMVISSLAALLVPGIFAVLSLVIPPRARSLGFTIGEIFAILGLPALIVVGAVADEFGVRRGFLVLVPVVLVATAMLASAGSFVAADMRKVQTAAAAQSNVIAARRRGEMKLLLVRDLDVSYDSVQVLFGVDFEVDEGEIVALLGTNGAGKSTLIRAISGLVEVQGGAIVFDGRDISYAPPNESAARGIIQIPGGKGVFPTLTVAENLNLAGWLYRRDAKHIEAATEQMLENFPVLQQRWNQRAGDLSGGEQQMLTLGMAFIAKPRLLMIDELTLGLAPVVVERLLETVKAIRDQGTTIILVEQSVNLALTIAETAYFMEKGEIRFHGNTTELLGRPDLLRSVFLEGAKAGTPAGNGRLRRRVSTSSHIPFEEVCARCGRMHDVVLETKALALSYGGIRAVDDVDLSVREGEILGIIGPNGAGKTSLFDLISGFATPDSGHVLVDGHDVTHLQPDERARRGLGRSFQDARLFPSMTVWQAIAVALERHVPAPDPIAAALGSPATRVSERKVAERVDELIDLMGLHAYENKFVSELSTGTRRVVDLACTMAHEPKVVLFDEPSSGIAQRETEALGPLLTDIRDRTGTALVVIEHDMPLVTSVSDRMLALDLGRVIATGTPKQVVSDPHVVESYLGSDIAAIQRSGRRADGRAGKTRARNATRRKPAKGRR
jgi:ABC-type branched-subunit amino acid transport system ATPase component/predicted MFS family arabinose efflux permease